MSEKFEMTDVEAKNVKSMANFVALFHSQAFLKSRLASISPALDLKYLSSMSLFKSENEEAAGIAINSILNHLWYLTEELVVLSIFDRELPSTLRQAFVVKLLSFPRAKHFPTGKIALGNSRCLLGMKPV